MGVILVFVGAVVVASLWLATVVLALVLPIRPDLVRIVRRFVCPPGADMKVETEQKRRRPGEKIVRVYYEGPDHTKHDVKVRALFVLWALAALVSVPIVIPVLLLVSGWLIRSGTV